VQFREIPGAISKGNTEQKALDNIIEVLEEVLRFEKKNKPRLSKYEPDRQAPHQSGPEIRVCDQTPL
jgi:predicted RNase H-like HicB family nuclease